MTMSLDDAHLLGFELAGRHTERFVEYIEAIDPDDHARVVPGLAWTVGQVVTHVQSVYERYTVDRRRAESPAAVAQANDEDVARLGIDLAASARSIRDQWALLGSLVASVPPEQEFPFHAGQTITMAGGWANLLGELLAHGDDLARATGRPFGVPGADLEIVWRFGLPVLGPWLTPEGVAASETWLLQMPFGHLSVVFDHGAVAVGDQVAGTPDHLLEVPDLEAFTLEVPYRRRESTSPLASLLGSRFVDL